MGWGNMTRHLDGGKIYQDIVLYYTLTSSLCVTVKDSE